MFYNIHLFESDIETSNAIKPVPGTDQYYAMRVKFLAQGNNGSKLGCRLVPKLLNGFRGEDLKFVDYSDILFM